MVLSYTPDFIEYIRTYFGGEAETVKKDDLVQRDELYYKKLTDIPFTGIVETF